MCTRQRAWVQALERALAHKKSAPERTHLLLGWRELSCLRFREREGKSELQRLPVNAEGLPDCALAGLEKVRSTLLRGVPLGDGVATWKAHNEDIETAFAELPLTEDEGTWKVLQLGMLLKAESMAARTKEAGPRDARAIEDGVPRMSERASGLVRSVERKALASEANEAVAASLRALLDARRIFCWTRTR